MHRRLRSVCSTASIPLLVMLLVLETIGCGKFSGTANVDSSAATLAEADPAFLVPDGKPAEILEFVRELDSRRPKFSSSQERFDYTVKAKKAMIRAGDQILAQEADDETLKVAATQKLIGTIGLAANRMGGSAENALAEVNRLRGDKRLVVASVANEYWIAARALNLSALSSIERTQLADEALQRVVNSKSSPDAIGDVAFLSDQFVRANETDSAASLFDRLADAIVGSTEDEKKRAIAPKLRVRALRLRLPGRQLELEGRLLSGGDFDWESYRGKVVLVDFWATWCGPCVGELPNVRAQYDKYHARGFDVVGISLDHDRRALERFVEQKAFPWKQLFDDAPLKGKGWQHPMAVRYGVTSIPAAFLVDRAGKVVSTEARGEELERLLSTLLVTEK